LEISTLAEPEIITLIGQKAKIEIGSEISFPQINENKKNLIWKFAGIKTELELQKMGNLFQLTYSTQMTKPNNEGSISGNKESSSAIIELDRPIQLFQIGFKTEGRNSEGLPIFQHIPILRELFGTTSNHSTYKRITGFLLLEEYANTKK
jgi:Bacterial type II and III secretion system protein